MKVERNESGEWNVRDNAGTVVATLATNDEAWRWIDRHEVHPPHLRNQTARRLGAFDVKQ